MSKSLVEALGDGAWSVSAVVFDLNDMLDDEKRPISERRSDAVIRTGVEMEMRECPYHDIREGHLMNVSALAQISNYFNDARAEMAAFRRVAVENANWFDMLVCIVDLLSQPAIYLLQHRDAHGPVPARMAVCHKLAAGFFGVLREVHERLALGKEVPLGVDDLLKVVEEKGALLGANEACAGSPEMIRKACVALVDGAPASEVEIDRSRLDIARSLALQVQIGIFWHLYDRVHLWPLVRGEFRQHLTPGNDFLAQKLTSAGNDMDEIAPPRPDCTRLPDALDAQLRRNLGDALCDATAPKLLQEDVNAATQLLNEPGSAVRYNGEVAPLALQVAHYLNAHRQIVGELSRLELELRKLLDFPTDHPIRLGAAVFPIPQALHWYELILGRRIGPDSHLTGSSTGIRSAVPAAAK
jgi:hypothetical protein